MNGANHTVSKELSYKIKPTLWTITIPKLNASLLQLQCNHFAIESAHQSILSKSKITCITCRTSGAVLG